MTYINCPYREWINLLEAKCIAFLALPWPAIRAVALRLVDAVSELQFLALPNRNISSLRDILADESGRIREKATKRMENANSSGLEVRIPVFIL